MAMHRIKPDVDVVMDVLRSVLSVRPDSDFIKSLHHQYQERGGLSKKQLQGLLSKAQQVGNINPSWLATLEAIILKKKSRQRSALPPIQPLYKKDESVLKLIESILQRAPQHKRVLFLKSKFENNEVLAPAELAELQKFDKLIR